jgi:hypothetical protein
LIVLVLNIIVAVLNILGGIMNILHSRKSAAYVSDEDREIVRIEALKNVIITNADNKKQSVRQGETAEMPKAAALKMKKKGKVKILEPDINSVLALF